MQSQNSGHLYVQYGCGLSAPKEWLNFDASPTLRIQKMPLVGMLLKSKLNVIFPDNVRYGDIVKGLPMAKDSCDGVFCSHTLEHLALQDFRTALQNTYKILKPGGIFRCIVPDLEFAARTYIAGLDNNDDSAAPRFIGHHTLLGIANRPKGMKGLVVSFFGNSHHLWMWDYLSLAAELTKAGFTGIRACRYHDSEDPLFNLVESADRFENAVAIECRR
jgi:SAM-dependent methyltransferase